MDDKDQRRDYPTRPFVAALAVVQKENAFLLIQRGKPPSIGAWGFPGGVQNAGETIADCAIRELEEETCVVAGHPRILSPFDTIEKEPDGLIRLHFLLVPVALSWVSGLGRKSEEVRAFGWFEETQLSGVAALPMVQHIMAAAKRS